MILRRWWRLPLGPRSVALVLAAVFLALGLGVLIGTALPPDRLWLERQQSLLAALETEFVAIRSKTNTYETDLAALQAEVAATEELVDALAPLAVVDHLAEQTVAVMVLGAPSAGTPEWQADLAQLLTQAGAAHVWWVTVAAAGGMSDVAAISGDVPAADVTPFAMPRLLAAVTAGNATDLALWQDQGLLWVTGTPAPIHALAVIQQGRLAAAFVTAMGDADPWPMAADGFTAGQSSAVVPRLVGGAVSGAEPDLARQWQAAGLPMVAAVERVAGQVALVLGLAGLGVPFEATP